MMTLCKPGGCPNIVSVLRQGETQDSPYLYIDMELCEGNLENYMQQHNSESASPITIQQVWTIMAQIANGLVHIHENNLVHRDLKPRNGNYLEWY
jgi:serine/threonine protein kinase